MSKSDRDFVVRELRELASAIESGDFDCVNFVVQRPNERRWQTVTAEVRKPTARCISPDQKA